MFDGLDGIDWASMHHAYGTADEVPDILRALRSPDPGERYKALDRYHSAVHHQGDVYSYTTVSLPFSSNLPAMPRRLTAQQLSRCWSASGVRPSTVAKTNTSRWTTSAPQQQCVHEQTRSSVRHGD
ncbi:hypothetical protein [Yinghuangia sp. YIM S10712]|uniref:hypothetical protein n=1 Tax=Yinghuangia sp. YIM S10712 TaxID=3436930 RepID=UPI003F530CCF